MSSEYVDRQSKMLQQRFLKQLYKISTNQFVNYFDFLVVAKTLQLRFQQTSHLVAIKNYFNKNNNVLNKQRLSSYLAVNTKVPKNNFPGKIIVKFVIPDFDPIKQVTDEDEQSISNDSFMKKRRRKSVGSKLSTIQYTDKASLLVKIKVDNIMKSLDNVIQSVKNNSIYYDGSIVKQDFNFDSFKKKVIKLIGDQKIKDEDLNAIFYLLDVNKNGILSKKQLIEITSFNFSDMLFKLYDSKIDIQTKKQSNELRKHKAKPSFTNIQLSDIEQSILTHHKPLLPIEDIRKPTKPRFGPLRHFNLQKPESQKIFPNKTLSRNISMQREKIQKLLKSKRPLIKKVNDSNETITSKLRRLFVQKVILPRQRMFEQYRAKGKSLYQKNFEIKNQK